MVSVNVITFVILKILQNLVEVSKITKNLPADLTFISTERTENVDSFVQMFLTIEIKNADKTFVFKNETVCTWATMQKYFRSSM